jgi:hypothetical protein
MRTVTCDTRRNQGRCSRAPAGDTTQRPAHSSVAGVAENCSCSSQAAVRVLCFYACPVKHHAAPFSIGHRSVRCTRVMQLGASAKSSAACAAKAHDLTKAQALPRHAATAVPNKAASLKKAPALPTNAPAAVAKKTAATTTKSAKIAAPSALAKNNKGTSTAPVATSAAASAVVVEEAGVLIPSDREGRARIIYNHYNSFFPVDCSGKMRWRDIDDEYCLSFGATARMQLVDLVRKPSSHASVQYLASSACRNSRSQRCFLTAT